MDAEEQVAVVGEGHALGEFVIVLVVVTVIELVEHVLAAAVTVLTEVIMLRDGQLVEDGGEVLEVVRLTLALDVDVEVGVEVDLIELDFVDEVVDEIE